LLGLGVVEEVVDGEGRSHSCGGMDVMEEVV
jgi:hypothetical protein